MLCKITNTGKQTQDNAVNIKAVSLFHERINNNKPNKKKPAKNIKKPNPLIIGIKELRTNIKNNNTNAQNVIVFKFFILFYYTKKYQSVRI